MPLKPRVVIIDDEASHRMLVRRALRELGGEIDEIESVAVARQRLTSGAFNFDLVFLDLNLAGTPGTAVLMEIRKIFKFSELPVVVLSTSALDIDVHGAYAAGANSYLVKSSNSEELRKTLIAAAKYFLQAF